MQATPGKWNNNNNNSYGQAGKEYPVKGSEVNFN